MSKSSIVGFACCLPALYLAAYVIFLGSTVSMGGNFTLRPLGQQTVTVFTRNQPVLEKSVTIFRPAMRAHSFLSGQKITITKFAWS